MHGGDVLELRLILFNGRIVCNPEHPEFTSLHTLTDAEEISNGREGVVQVLQIGSHLAIVVIITPATIITAGRLQLQKHFVSQVGNTVGLESQLF